MPQLPKPKSTFAQLQIGELTPKRRGTSLKNWITEKKMVAEFVSLKKTPNDPRQSPLFYVDEFLEELNNFAKFQRMNASNKTVNEALENLRKIWYNYFETHSMKYHLLRNNGKSPRKSWEKIMKGLSQEIASFLSDYSVSDRRMIASFFIDEELREVAKFFALIPDEKAMGRILVKNRETLLCYWLEYRLFKEHLMFRHPMSQFLADSVEFLLFDH